MKMPLPCLALFAAVLASVAGAAGESPEAGALLAGLERSETVHFTVWRDYEADEYDEKLLFALERNFSRLQREFWDFIPPEHREGHVEVIIFSDRGRFDSFAAAESGMPHGEQGYLSTHADRMAFLKQGELHKDVTIGVHELVHVFNSWCTPYTPVWLDEGMAQFYSYFAAAEAGNASLVDGINPDALARIDDALEAGTLVRIGTLIQMDEEVFYGSASDVNFASSWALVYYLMRGLGAQGEMLFSRFYGVISRGGDPYRAFTGSYGANMEMLQHFWLGYLERLYEDYKDLAGAAGAGKPEKKAGAAVKSRPMMPVR